MFFVKKSVILARRRDTFGHGEELCFCCDFLQFPATQTAIFGAYLCVDEFNLLT